MTSDLLGLMLHLALMQSFDTIGTRLKWAINRKGTTNSALSRACDISRNAVGQWVNDTTTPTDENLTTAARFLNVPFTWLRTGEGELPPDLGEPKVESAVDSDLGRVRSQAVSEIDVRMGAGGQGFPAEAYVYDDAGNSYAAEPIKAEWQLPAQFLRDTLKASPRDLRIFEVIGDSMEPRLSEGDRVFVDLRHKHPQPEGIFALHDGLGLVIKRLQLIRGTNPVRVRIISVNESYPPQEAALDEIVVIGRLAGRFTLR